MKRRSFLRRLFALPAAAVAVPAMLKQDALSKEIEKEVVDWEFATNYGVPEYGADHWGGNDAIEVLRVPAKGARTVQVPFIKELKGNVVYPEQEPFKFIEMTYKEI